MKKTIFKQKTLEDVKKKQAEKREKEKNKLSKLSKKSKKTKHITVSKLKELIWIECRRIIRERYGNTCYTSGVTDLSGKNRQTGHGISKGSLPMRFKFDLRNLRPQSLNENIHNGGNSYVFVMKLEKEKEGLQFLKDACIKNEQGIWKPKKETMGSIETWNFLNDLLKEYKNIQK